MKLYILGFILLAFAGFSIGMGRVAPVPLLAPVRTVTVEAGVVPPGASLVVRTNEAVNTDRALRTTIYDAKVASGIQDQNGKVLIPSMSPVELAVDLVQFIGPGGVGMSELVLDVRAVTVKGVRYEIEMSEGKSKRYGFEPRGAVAVDSEGPDHVRTSGRRIDVPAGAVLKFHTAEPIRLRGYQR
jgi:hypothetical protein